MSTVFESELRLKSGQANPDLAATDLLILPDEKEFELIDGQLVKREMGNISSGIAIYLGGLISIFCRKNHLGWVCGADGGFVIAQAGKESVRRPDISVYKVGRLPPGQGWASAYELIAPDLAVEVVSPNDLATEVETKIEDFQSAGVKLIWVIHPVNRIVTTYRLDGRVTRLHESDQLDGEDVLPGFSCSIAETLEIPPSGIEIITL